MSDIVLLCNCGVTDPPNLNRPWLHFTHADIATLTRDHPVTAVGMCDTCKCTAYIMRKCICMEDGK